jgi:hypothetical protein
MLRGSRARGSTAVGVALVAPPVGNAEERQPSHTASSAQHDARAYTADGGSSSALTIYALPLSRRSWNALRRQNILLVSSLCALPPQQVAAVRGIGPESLAEIQAALAQIGLNLSDHPATRHYPNINPVGCRDIPRVVIPKPTEADWAYFRT